MGLKLLEDWLELFNYLLWFAIMGFLAIFISQFFWNYFIILYPAWSTLDYVKFIVILLAYCSFWVILAIRIPMYLIEKIMGKNKDMSTNI